MAAIAGVLAQKRVSDRRKEKQRQKEDAQSFIKNILKKYDSSMTGHIHPHLVGLSRNSGVVGNVSYVACAFAPFVLPELLRLSQAG